LFRIPLSSVLSPFVPHGERKKSSSFETVSAVKSTLRGRVVAKQSFKTGLFKMKVVSQRASHAACLHQVKRNAVGERPFFVGAVAVQLKPAFKKFGRCVNERVAWIFKHQANDGGGSVTVRTS
jgi:hypothetical protein